MTLPEVVAALAQQAVWALLLAVPVALADRALGRRLPALRWGLWNLVLLRLALPAGLSAPWGWRPWHGLGGIAAAAEAPLTIPLLAALPGGTPEAPLDRSSAIGWLVLALAWSVGAAWCGARWWHARRRHLELTRQAELVSEGRLFERAEAWRRRLGITRRIRLVVSDTTSRPFTLGVLRPVVCLPRELVDPESHDLEAVLGHEIAHVRHLDDLALRVEACLGALFWFHPATWLARRRLDHLRERLCDSAVVASGAVTKSAYARALLAQVAVSRGLDLAPPQVIPSWRDRSTRQELRERIEGALEARRRPRRILCLTACLAAAFILLPAPPRAGAAVQTPDPGSTQEPAIHWTRPVPGARLTSPFGPRRDPFTGDAAHHDGVDLGAPEGTPVVAMADGTVSVATEHDEAEPARGTLVVIDHPGGYRSLYSHLQDLEVETGQAVTAGQTIGHLGRTGAVTAPHVHVEVHHDGQPVDPAGLWAP